MTTYIEFALDPKSNNLKTASGAMHIKYYNLD